MVFTIATRDIIAFCFDQVRTTKWRCWRGIDKADGPFKWAVSCERGLKAQSYDIASL
jgi:hypothetical protein